MSQYIRHEKQEVVLRQRIRGMLKTSPHSVFVHFASYPEYGEEKKPHGYMSVNISTYNREESVKLELYKNWQLDRLLTSEDFSRVDQEIISLIKKHDI